MVEHPIQPIPFHFAEKLYSGKALHCKGLGHNFKDLDWK